MPPIALSPTLPGKLDVVGIGHEGVVAAFAVDVVLLHAGQLALVVAERLHLVLAAAPQGNVVVAAIGRDAHEGLAHEAGDDVELARHLGADLAVGRQPVGRPQRIVIGEIELELAGRILVIALDHVEAHLAAIVDDAEIDRTQALELIDVIAIRIGIAAGRLAVLVLLEPHHLGLGTVPELEPMLLLEQVVDAAEIAARVRGQERAWLGALLAVSEQRAPHARHPLVPGELHEGVGLGDADQLGGLGPVAEILAAPVDEQVHGGAVDELEALLGNAFPMVGGDALAHDAAGHRHELQVKIVDAELVDLLADLLDELLALGVLDEPLDISLPSLNSRHTPFTQLHGNGLWEVGCNSPLANRVKRNGSSSALFSPSSSCATSLPTPIIL